MRFLICSLLLAGAAWGFQPAQAGSASVEEQSHPSQVLGGTRTYRVFLPARYAASQKRYPVIYWLYGYEQANPEREKEISAYVGTHDLIVVYVGPVETTGEYPMYFPELVDHVDRTLRTLADRDHRATTGYSVGGFLSFYTAGKYPGLVGSASSFLGVTESQVGPRGAEVDYRLHELYGNYDGVRTRLVADPREPAHFYHQRLNDIWLFARTGHETSDFDRDRANTAIPQTFDFHMHAFAAPLPKPASFSHQDAYPNFDVWGWQVSSNRRQPGFTMLNNVSAKGFRSAVRSGPGWRGDSGSQAECRIGAALSAGQLPHGHVPPRPRRRNAPRPTEGRRAGTAELRADRRRLRSRYRRGGRRSRSPVIRWTAPRGRLPASR